MWGKAILSATDKHFAFHKICTGARTDLVSRLRTSQPRSFRLTFRPRSYICRKSSRLQVEEKDIRAFRPAPSTEFRGGTCCGSHLGWGAYLQNLSRGVETHSKTLTREIQSQGLNLYFLMTKDPEIIPGYIHSKDRES